MGLIRLAKQSVCVLLLSIAPALAGELVPLECWTKEHDLEIVREAIKGGFEDVVESPTLVNEWDFMEILLVPNGFITLEELHCDITFEETVKGLKIKAVPYQVIDGQKVEYADFAARKGVYMMIEGAALECDYEVEAIPEITPEMGGFINYNNELPRLTELLEGGQPPVISFAQYGTAGRVYQVMSPAGDAYVQLEEDPNSRNQVLRLWVIMSGSSSQGLVEDWLDEIDDAYLDGDGDLEDIFFGGATQKQVGAYDVYIQVEGGQRYLQMNDTATVRASKVGY